jgi:hypothetical protein
VALYHATEKKEHRERAVQELSRTAHFWRLYASTALGQYKNPLWTNRVGHVDWRRLYDYVRDDLIAAQGGGVPGVPSIASTPGGMILEAEEATHRGARAALDARGHTGSGFLNFRAPLDESYVEFTFDAPTAGTYILELRYVAWEGQDPARVTLDGRRAGDIILWPTGGERTWAWDRKTVALTKGPNTIRLAPNGPVWIDHLNILYGGPMPD